MSYPQETRKTPPAAPALVFAGAVVAVVAWLLPVSLKSVSKGLLRSAGAGTPSVAAFGRDLVDSEKIGPAMFLLDVARAVGDPRAPALGRALDALASRQPELGCGPEGLQRVLEGPIADHHDDRRVPAAVALG